MAIQWQMCSNVLLHSSFKKHFVLASHTHKDWIFQVLLLTMSVKFMECRLIQLTLTFVWVHFTPPTRSTKYHTDHTNKLTFTFIPSNYPITHSTIRHRTTHIMLISSWAFKSEHRITIIIPWVYKSELCSHTMHYLMSRTYAAILKNWAVHRFKSWTPLI